MKKSTISLLLVICLLVFAVQAMTIEADAATTYVSGDWTYSVTSGVATITKYSGTASSVTIPKMMDNLYLVNAIGEKAFAGNVTMTSVSFPDTLTSIGRYAFSGCVGLKSVTLPSKLATLGERSFQNCFNLEKIIVQSTALNNIANYSGHNGQPFYQAGIGTSGISVVFEAGVTRIPNDMFYARAGNAYAANITSVTIADSVTSIGNNAFYGCVFLKSVDCGDGVQTIGESAFNSCSALVNIALPENALLKINKNAFANCTKMENIVLPDTLTNIGDYAFNGCVSLKSVTLPLKLATIGQRAFQNCTGVSTITVNSAAMNDIDNYSGTNGSPFYNAGIATDGIAVVFGSTCTKIPARLFNAYANPACAANIVSVTISKNVTTIGQSAFGYCPALRTVDMGTGVTTVNAYAFKGCTALTTVAYSTALTVLGDEAFMDCTNLTSSKLPVSLTKIGASAFRNCSGLTEIILPDTLTNIGDYAFCGCIGFSDITLPVNLATIGQRAFQDCVNVSAITVNTAAMNDVSNYSGTNGSPFYNVGSATEGVNVTFSNSCTKIPARLFNASANPACAANIINVSIADSVTYIGDSAFYSCTSLKTVDMGKGVKYVDPCAFMDCSSLTTVKYSDALTTIKKQAFRNCTSLKSGTLNTALTTIGDYAFQNCSALTSVTLPEDLSSMGQRVFQNCQSITKITVKSVDLKDIGNYSGTNGQPFYCAGLEGSGITVTFADGVTRIAGNLFGAHAGAGYAPNIKKVTVASSVKEVGTNAFLNCTNLTSIRFFGDAPKVNNNAFSGVTTTAYYPLNKNWADENLVDYSGSLTWKGFYTAEITTQPKTTYTKQGNTAKVTVKAVGDGAEYKWYYKNSGDSKFTKSSNTTATYSVKMSSTTKNRQVYCVVTDKYGNSVQSNTVYLRRAVSISTQPQDLVVAKGDTAKLTVKALGDGLKYEWYYKDAGSSEFKKSTITSSTYSVEMTAARHERQVYCKVIDKYGKTAKTDTVTLSIEATVTTQPKSVAVAKGETAKLTVKALGDGLKYEWYYKDADSSSYKKSTITKSAYSVEMTNARHGRKVYCKVTDQYGNTVKTNTVTLSMEATITTQPKNVVAADGETVVISFKAIGEGLKYEWYYKNAGSSSYKKTTASTSNKYTTEMTEDRHGRKIYCKVTDKYGNVAKTDVITLSIEATVTTQPKTTYAEKGETVKISVQAIGDGLTYKWYYKNDGASKFTKSSVTKSTYSVTMSNSTMNRQVYCVVTDQYGNSTQTKTVCLRMALAITSQPESVTVEKGDTAEISIKAVGDGLKYEWYYKNDGDSSFTKSTSDTSNTYSVKMTAARDGRKVYCKVTDKYGNTVKSNTVTLWIF